MTRFIHVPLFLSPPLQPPLCKITFIWPTRFWLSFVGLFDVEALYQNTCVVAASRMYAFPIRDPGSLCDFRVPFASLIHPAAAPSEIKHDETQFNVQSTSAFSLIDFFSPTRCPALICSGFSVSYPGVTSSLRLISLQYRRGPSHLLALRQPW
jgi:hypothetical protein